MTQSQQVIEELYDFYTKTAANIISYYDGNERKEKLKELRDIVYNNCVQDKKLKSVENIKHRLLDLHNLNNDDEENEERPNNDSIINEYKEAISEIDIDVTNDNKLLEFDKHVEALLDRLADKEDGEDAELQLSGGYINVIDPISKKRIVDPVKNTICGHTYDRETITKILQISKTRCPVMGCRSNEFVTLAHLRTDIVTKTYLEKNPA